MTENNEKLFLLLSIISKQFVRPRAQSCSKFGRQIAYIHAPVKNNLVLLLSIHV